MRNNINIVETRFKRLASRDSVRETMAGYNATSLQNSATSLQNNAIIFACTGLEHGLSAKQNVSRFDEKNIFPNVVFYDNICFLRKLFLVAF
jgi:hypothetical protein